MSCTPLGLLETPGAHVRPTITRVRTCTLVLCAFSARIPRNVQKCATCDASQREGGINVTYICCQPHNPCRCRRSARGSLAGGLRRRVGQHRQPRIRGDIERRAHHEQLAEHKSRELDEHENKPGFKGSPIPHSGTAATRRTRGDLRAHRMRTRARRGDAATEQVRQRADIRRQRHKPLKPHVQASTCVVRSKNRSSASRGSHSFAVSAQWHLRDASRPPARDYLQLG
jgi:hypothetical protein